MSVLAVVEVVVRKRVCFPCGQDNKRACGIDTEYGRHRWEPCAHYEYYAGAVREGMARALSMAQDEPIWRLGGFLRDAISALRVL
jgi:hypothetical protein